MLRWAPFLNSNCASAEIWESISDVISQFTMCMIVYPIWDFIMWLVEPIDKQLVEL